MAQLHDGFKTTIAFQADADIKVYETEVSPPGVSSGGSIDFTTMRNSAWRTKKSKKLKSLEDAGIKVAYDPACYTEIIAIVGTNTQITVTFPDLSTLVFWGFIESFTPNGLTEGNMPVADIKIVASNLNGSAVETAPAWTAAP